MGKNNGVPYRTCGECYWYTKQPMGVILNAKEQGFCYGVPPQCTTTPVGGGPAGTKVASFTNRPSVKPGDRACGIFRNCVDAPALHRPLKIFPPPDERTMDDA